MTICPCCGFKFQGALTSGCTFCGARAVGEPLPKPARELPSYGRSLAVTVGGSLIVLFFVAQTIIAVFQRGFSPFGFWSWVAAGETAAWRLKWVALPVLFVFLWIALKLYRSIREQPARFCGLKHARRGLLASAVVGLLIATLIGITVPARLRQRQMSIDAASQARLYTYDLILFKYKKQFKSLPPDQASLKEELAKLPDPDGSIAAALRELDPLGYQPRAEVAAVSGSKSNRLRGVAIRNVSYTSATDDTPPGGLSFTNYELRLPGEDKILGNDDDWIIRDGVISRVSDIAKGGVGRAASAEALKP